MGDLGHLRRHMDDAAAAGLGHDGNREAAHLIGAGDVDVERGLPFRLVELGKGRVTREDRRAINQNMEPAELRAGGVNGGLRRLARAHVAIQGNAGGPATLRIASWLEQHDAIQQVIYPGLPSHPQYDIATRQMSHDGTVVGGGMITCNLHGGLEASKSFLEKLNLFALAESLGGVESLVEHPAIMTHASVAPEKLATLGIDDGLVRLSVGIEDCEDLLEDLEQALQ